MSTSAVVHFRWNDKYERFVALYSHYDGKDFGTELEKIVGDLNKTYSPSRDVHRVAAEIVCILWNQNRWSLSLYSVKDHPTIDLEFEIKEDWNQGSPKLIFNALKGL